MVIMLFKMNVSAGVIHGLKCVNMYIGDGDPLFAGLQLVKKV